MAERIANAINLLGADSNLLDTDGEVLLELIADYWCDENEGKLHPLIKMHSILLHFKGFLNQIAA